MSADDHPLHGRPSATRQRGVLLALLLVAAVWATTLLAVRAPVSKPLDAAQSEFSGARAKALLQRLVGDNLPHPLGSAANERMRERIVAQLRQLGLAPELQSGVMVCNHFGVCGMPTNILARIQGSDAGSQRAVLLVAHYDSVAAGPGASDNATGVAAVLEIARLLPLLPRSRQSIILLLDDGEEPGLLGAQAFVEHHRWADSVSAAVNLDARGTSGPSLMFETGSANRWLIGLYAGAVSRPLTNSLYYAVYQLLPNDTDFSVFKAAGLQGFNFAFIGDVARYHTPLDNALHADADSLQHQGDNALATLLALANAGPEPPPAGEAVYFDLFAKRLVRIPQTWVAPAALITALLILIGGARLLQRRLLRGRALLWGILGQVGALSIGATAAVVLMALLRALGAVSAGGAGAAIAYPWALELSFAALALFITALTGARLQRQAGFWGLAYVGTLLSALLALALARWLPGASYLALLPAIVALVALLPVAWPSSPSRETSAWLPGAELAAVAVCVATFVLVLPVALPLYSALGDVGLPLLTLLLIYSGGNLAALVALAGRRLQRTLIAAAALCCLLGLIAVSLLPRHTAESPQRLSLSYELNADTQQAQWVTDPPTGELAESLRRAAAFVRGTQPMFPWRAPSWAAAAPNLPIAAPQLSLLAVQRGDTRQLRYRVHIGSVRAAPVIALAFAPGAKVDSVRFEGNAASGLLVSPWRLKNGWSRVRLLSLPPDGQELSFEAGEAALDLKLFDESYDLPLQGLVLQRARPRIALPSQDGDVTIVMRGYRLQPFEGGTGDAPVPRRSTH